MTVTTSIPSSWSVRLRSLILIERVRSMLSAVIGGDVQRSQREQVREFSEIIRDYGQVISGICFSYATSSDDLKDLRQDILINIWKGLSNFKGESSLSTWIYRVALNTCVSTVRKRSKRVDTVQLSPAEDIADNEDYDPERTEILHRLISGLSPLDKAVITMWLDERSYEEISKVTGISRGNVAVRINRIKQRFKDTKL